MSEEYKGCLEVINLKGVDGAETLDLHPATGYQYALIDIWGYHDDTTADLQWIFVDAILTLTASKLAVTRLTNVPHPIGVADAASFIYLDSQRYLRLSANAIGAGKFLYIRGLVRKWLAP